MTVGGEASVPRSELLKGNGAMMQVENLDGFILLALHGSIDIASVSKLEATFATLTDQPIVVVSLVFVSYLDSSTLSVLVRQQNARDGRLMAILPRDSPLERIFDITGLRQYLRLTPNAEKAIELAQQLRDVSAASFSRDGVAIAPQRTEL